MVDRRVGTVVVAGRMAGLVLLVAIVTGCGRSADAAGGPATESPAPTASGASTGAALPSTAPPGSGLAATTHAAAATATHGAATLPCGPFEHPLDPLDGAVGVEGTGCGPGQTPPFTVSASGWGFSFAYTCTGGFGSDGMRDSVVVTPVKVSGGTVLASSALSGQWGHGASLAGEGTPAPAGRYVLKVTLAHPEANQCRWHLGVPGSTP